MGRYHVQLEHRNRNKFLYRELQMSITEIVYKEYQLMNLHDLSFKFGWKTCIFLRFCVCVNFEFKRKVSRLKQNKKALR